MASTPRDAFEIAKERKEAAAKKAAERAAAEIECPAVLEARGELYGRLSALESSTPKKPLEELERLAGRIGSRGCSREDAEEGLQNALVAMIEGADKLPDLRRDIQGLIVYRGRKMVWRAHQRAEKKRSSSMEAHVEATGREFRARAQDVPIERLEVWRVAQVLRERMAKVKSDRVIADELGIRYAAAEGMRALLRRQGLLPHDSFNKIWTEDTVIGAFREWAENHGGVAPTINEVKDDPHVPHVRTVCDIFGSWNEGIRAAGLEPHPSGGRQTPKTELAQRVLHWAVNEGRWPSARDMEATGSSELPAQATLLRAFHTVSRVLLYDAVERTLGDEALQAAPPRPTDFYVNPPDLARRIKDWQEEHRVWPSGKDIRSAADLPSETTVRKILGTASRKGIRERVEELLGDDGPERPSTTKLDLEDWLRSVPAPAPSAATVAEVTEFFEALPR